MLNTLRFQTKEPDLLPCQGKSIQFACIFFQLQKLKAPPVSDLILTMLLNVIKLLFPASYSLHGIQQAPNSVIYYQNCPLFNIFLVDPQKVYQVVRRSLLQPRLQTSMENEPKIGAQREYSTWFTNAYCRGIIKFAEENESKRKGQLKMSPINRSFRRTGTCGATESCILSNWVQGKPQRHQFVSLL